MTDRADEMASFREQPRSRDGEALRGAVAEVGSGSGSLADQAYARIKAAIVSCELAPGQRITERLLAARLGLGLSPIRSALVRLDNEGLVRTRPRSGYRVTPLTIEDVDSLFDAWSVVGSAILARAAARWTPRDRAQMRKMVREVRSQQRQAGTDMPDAAVVMARAIWRGYCQLAGNPRLTRMFERLDADLQRVFVIGAWEDPQEAERFVGTSGERELQLDDPAAAVEGFRTYISSVHRQVIETLQRSTSVRSHEIVLNQTAEI
jgi:DNA-binding GntR family transcriptional regulator